MTPRKGFTLLEVMVAVVILGTAVAAISGVISTSLRNVGRAEDYERVVLLSRSQMYELLALPEWHADRTWQGKWDAGYQWTAVSARVPEIPPGEYELMRITLVATWQTSRGQKSYTLETVRAQRTLQ